MPFAVQRRVLASLTGNVNRFVSIDPHLPVTEESLGDCRKALADADAFFPGEDELLLEGTDVDPRRVLPRVVSGRLRFIVFKQGARGGILYDAREERFHRWRTRSTGVVDATGAGDAFAAGFISAHLEGLPISVCIDRGVVSASFAIEAPGAASLLTASRTDADSRISQLSAAGAGS